MRNFDDHARNLDNRLKCNFVCNKKRSSNTPELSEDGSISSYKNVCFENKNETSKMRNFDDHARTLDNRLKCNFICKNDANLSKPKLNDARISMPSKRLNFNMQQYE